MFKIGLISDDITRQSLEGLCSIVNLTPLNYRFALRLSKPDFIFIESTWNGFKNSWKYKIASYPDNKRRSNSTLVKLIELAKSLGIPTVFWNKEDGVHFERFIDSAKHCDHVFTVDNNCIERYKKIIGTRASIHSLMFAVQPQTHFFDGFNFKYKRANFLGSYSRHIHEKRRLWQDMFFSASSQSDFGLTIVDRNSERKSENYRYPSMPGIEVLPALSHFETAQFYKDYVVSLNINTIEDSDTMFSRRLIEILACGGIAVTNPSKAVEKLFKDYCHVIHSQDEAAELFARMKAGPTQDDLDRAEAGAHFVLKNHTWSHRLQQIAMSAGIKT